MNEELLTELIISESITNIQKTMFSGCSTLRKVVIPSTVTEISKGAFSGCSSIEEITIPYVGGTMADSPSESTLFGYIFGDELYHGSTALIQYYDLPYGKSVYYIPANLTKVEIEGGKILFGAFYDCSMLKTITI